MNNYGFYGIYRIASSPEDFQIYKWTAFMRSSFDLNYFTHDVIICAIILIQNDIIQQVGHE